VLENVFVVLFGARLRELGPPVAVPKESLMEFWGPWACPVFGVFLVNFNKDCHQCGIDTFKFIVFSLRKGVFV